MEGSRSAKKPRMGRRRLVGLGIGLGTLIAGVFVLADQTWVASQLQPVIGSSLGANGTAAVGMVPYGGLSYMVYAVGFGLIVSGIGLMRSIFRSSVSSYVSGGGPGAMGIDPEALNNMMKTSMAQMSAMGTATVPPKETVKVKCLACGSLEAEDAAFCHKCGQPM